MDDFKDSFDHSMRQRWESYHLEQNDGTLPFSAGELALERFSLKLKEEIVRVKETNVKDGVADVYAHLKNTI